MNFLYNDKNVKIELKYKRHMTNILINELFSHNIYICLFDNHCIDFLLVFVDWLKFPIGLELLALPRLTSPRLTLRTLEW